MVCIIFDIGGVLVEDNFDIIASRLVKYTGLDKEAVYRAFIMSDTHEYAAGEMSDIQRWRLFFKTIGSKAGKKDIDFIRNLYLAKLFKPIRPNIKLFESLCKKNRVGLLSDQANSTYNRLKNLEFYKISNFKLISCLEGSSKAKQSFFSKAIKISGCKRPYYIDDRPWNLERGRKEGMKTILYKNPRQLRKELKGFL